MKDADTVVGVDPGGEDTTKAIVVGIDLTTGKMSQVEVDVKVGVEYIDMHRVVPSNIDTWGEAHMRSVASLAEIEDAGDRAWKTAMILLAHHRSVLARDLLKGLKEKLPAGLAEFYSIALGEAESWLEPTQKEHKP